MEIYFGELTKEDLEHNLQELDEMFHYMGKYYWYKAVVGSEDLVLYDTCGRHFPIPLDLCHETDLVMLCARKHVEAQEAYDNKIREAQEAYDNKIREAHELINFFNQQ